MIRNTIRTFHRKHNFVTNNFPSVGVCYKSHNSHFKSPETRNYSTVYTNQRRYLRLYHHKCVKHFIDTENAYCFNVLESQMMYKDAFKIRGVNKNVADLEAFNVLLNKNYRVAGIDEIVAAFKDVKAYCVENNINLSDRKFDNLVDGLVDHCEYLTDEQLYELLEILAELPQCEGLDSHNFHDVWSCLDDICCWKMHKWDIDASFVFAGAWYKLHLGKVSDYVHEVIEKTSDKSQYLTKKQVVQAFFYINVCRKQHIDFPIEDAAARHIKDMTVDEMAIVALGFFKSQCKIKILEVLEAMMKKVIDESRTINEISLTAITKVVRLSKRAQLIPVMNAMLDKIVPEMDRLSHLACLHVAVIGTGLQAMHRKSLLKATEKVARDISNVEKVRLKDIERLLMALTMFDIDPKDCLNFYELAYNELHNEKRLGEIVKYTRSLPTCLNFLSLRNIYCYDLTNKVLDIDYITEVYGKAPKQIPTSILFLDASIDVECPDYKGNRLPPEKKYKAAKWHVEYVPSYDQYTRLTPVDKFFLETVDLVESILKSARLIRTDHVLPNFAKADIILCKDVSKNEFIEPFGFEKYILGDVKFPVKDKNLKWYALIIVGWNNTLKGTNLPLGHMMMKKRQLETIGYMSEFVIWNEFIQLPKEAKIQYLLTKIS